MTLSVMVACWTGDEEKALSMFRWIAELGRVDTTCYILCSKDCQIAKLVETASLAFTKVEHVLDHINRKSNWTSNDEGARDASGPNSMFEQAAWFMHVPRERGPWLFLEPDCRPLTPDWFYVIRSEYESCGKPVMGDYITTNSPHISGVAVYPADVPRRFPKMIHNVQGAFDTADAPNVISQAHITKRIQDCWRTEVWDEATFNKIRPEAVLFCGTKNDDLLPYLRRKLGMKGGDASCPTQSASPIATADTTKALQIAQSTVGSNGAGRSHPSPAPIVDIYLKTWARDHELANLCLKSIEKFVTGYRSIVIEDPKLGGGSTLHPQPLCIPFGLTDNVKMRKSEDRDPSYLYQQFCKLTCQKHSDAEYFLMVDSDCCFNRKVDVSEFFKDGKPKWRYTPLNLARPDQSSTWVPVMRKFLGSEPQHEFMREHPHIVPRWLLDEMEKFCLYKHGMNLGDYIMAQAVPGMETALVFSEFNCAGFFAWTFHRDKFAWIPDDEATPVLVQGFTWGGNERIRQDIERAKQILGEEEEKAEKKETWRAATVFSEKGADPMTLENVMSFLKREAIQSPLHKARLIRKFNSVMAEVKPAKTITNKSGKKKVTNGAVSDSENGFLLAIQTYPGGNEGLARHWPHLRKSGATRIVAITTTDGLCTVPRGCEEVQIGANRYIDGPHLPMRLMDTLTWCLSQKEYDRFVLCEWDTIFLKKIEFTETSLYLTGGQVTGASAPYFFHQPYLLTRDDALRVRDELGRIIADGVCSPGKPDCSPDLAFGLAVSNLKLEYQPLNIFSRNNLSEPGMLEMAIKKARDGVVAIHGVKTIAHLHALETEQNQLAGV